MVCESVQHERLHEIGDADTNSTIDNRAQHDCFAYARKGAPTFWHPHSLQNKDDGANVVEGNALGTRRFYAVGRKRKIQ